MKKIFLIILIVLVVLGIGSCRTRSNRAFHRETSRFEYLESVLINNVKFYIVYDKYTWVMYTLSMDGIATPMINYKGDPVLWDPFGG